MFCKKGILKNFVNFTEKHLRCNHLLTKLHFWGFETLLKKIPRQIVPVKFAKVLRTTILKNICEGMFLNFLKRDFNTDVFLSILRIIQEHLFCIGSTNGWFRNTSAGSLFNKVASLTNWRSLTVLERTVAQVFLGEFY